MKPLTITIQPPVTEYCDECGYTNSYSFNSFHCDCPKCGKRLSSVYSPRTKAIRVYSIKGRYNLLSNYEQTQYRFTNVPDGLKCGYVVDEDDIDTSDPLECSRELLKIYEKYLYYSKLPDLKKLVEYLESVEEEQHKMRIFEEKEKLEFDLYKFYHTNRSMLEEKK